MNILEKCRKLGRLKASSSEIIKDICGQGGLLHCDTRESYQFLCNKLMAKWSYLEDAEKKNALFSQKNVLCDHMRLPLSKENRLGSQLIAILSSP